MSLCKCGCGGEVTEGKEFKKGHYRKWSANNKSQSSSAEKPSSIQFNTTIPGTHDNLVSYGVALTNLLGAGNPDQTTDNSEGTTKRDRTLENILIFLILNALLSLLTVIISGLIYLEAFK